MVCDVRMLVFSLCCCRIWYLLETWGRIFGVLILRLIVVFVLLYIAWLCAGWMRVRIGWFATSQLRQQPCVRHSFSPRITALNLMRSHQYLPLLSVCLWSILAHLFPSGIAFLDLQSPYQCLLFSGLPAESGVTVFSLSLSLRIILANLLAVWNCISRFGESLPVSGVLWSFF